MALSLAGRLSFNPVTDSLIGADGKPFKLSPPSGEELPARGYEAGVDLFQPPRTDREVQVAVDPGSSRLQLLAPFEAWHGKDFTQCPILIKVGRD